LLCSPGVQILKKKLLFVGLQVLLSGLFAMPATADALTASAEHLPYAAAPARAQDARRQGALYRVTRDGQVSYLFGTIHVGTKAFYPLAPEVSRALADSSTLVLELDTRANDAFLQAVAKHGSYAPGDTIGRHVSADTLASLVRALHANGIALANVAHLKPWLLANLLMGLELERSGFVRSQGVEHFLLSKAQAHGTAVAELESADYQLALFDTLGDADSERYLRESLRNLADGTSLRKAKAVIAAWSSGDAAALDALVVDATAGGTVTSDFTRRTLLGRRNPEMAAQIERIMQDGKIAFVGVGLLHLLGANGLPELLSQRGYQVERMY
jgi:uncharacterized protein YbaP (TraB family)